MAEMFLELDGIKGESQDEARPKSHKDEIEIKAWKWTSKNVVRWDVNQGGQSTRTDISSIEIDKFCDKASVALYQHCLTGKHIKSGKITCRKNDGEEKVEYLIVKLKDIMVSRVSWAGDGSDQSLNETVELSFAEFHMEFKVQKETGDAAGGIGFGYNIQKQRDVAA